MVNGHAVATLVTAPSDDQPWPFEVPYPTAPERLGDSAIRGTSNSVSTVKLSVSRAFLTTSGSTENVPRAPTLPTVPLPPISCTCQSLPFRQPLPSIQAVLRSTQPRTWPPPCSPFFLAHPPDVLPPPPLRLLTGPPVIVEESTDSTSDESMPPVSPKDPEDEPDAAASSKALVNEDTPSTQLESNPTTVQKWAVSNARLERLRYDARRCGMLQGTPDKQTPKYVFGAYGPIGSTDPKKDEVEPTARDVDEMEPRAEISSDESDDDKPPSLVSPTPEDGESQDDESPDGSQALVLHAPAPATQAPSIPAPTMPAPLTSGPTMNINIQDLEGYLARTVRAPPTPSNHNWTLIQEWTCNHGAFLAHVFGVENNDVLAFIRKADALIRRFPEVLDVARMRVNKLIDTDLVNVLQYPEVTTESCAQFADRMQRVRESINAYSPGLMDSTHAIHDIHPTWISFYTELWIFVLAFIRYLDELFRRRHWSIDETLLHQPAPIPPPYLHPFEYQGLCVLHYTFGEHGQDDVVHIIDKFL
ncbi:hypothetical protein DFH06DRAFT_1322986 [Mycena polygramma]|nr:hypothetical protein DFH06DRAFT_1322986 [Mycena polygramma]